MSWTHEALQTDLANHLHAGGQRLVWTNIVMGEAGAPRPDVLTLDPISWSSTEFIAYEVKISVADFRKDTTSGKWQKYLGFAQGVTFAVPTGLVEIGDVPGGCGLIQRSDAGWRYRRRPTLGVWQLNQVQMMKLAREPRHRPTARFTQNEHDPNRHWREDRLSRIEANVVRKAIAKIGERLGRNVARYLHDAETADGVVAKAREEAAQILSKARDAAAEERQQVQATYDELARVLGLEPGQSRWTIQREVRAASLRLSKDGEVRHLRDQLAAVEKALHKARPLGAAGKPRRVA